MAKNKKSSSTRCSTTTRLLCRCRSLRVAVTTKLETSIVMSLAVIVAMLGSNVAVAAIRKHIPPSIRIIVR